MPWRQPTQQALSIGISSQLMSWSVKAALSRYSISVWPNWPNERVLVTPNAKTVQPGNDSQTEEGTILGTVSYMSPEQAEGKKLDARSDIFSFGSVLFEMVTGQRAFQGDSKMSTLAAILNKDPRSVKELSETVP